MSFAAAQQEVLLDRLNERHDAARQRAVITADELVAKLRSWARGGAAPRPCLVRRVEHADVLDLRGFRCNRRLDLSGFYFEVAVDLRDSRIDGPLFIRDAVFEFGLHLGGARIKGAFDVTRSIFEHPDPEVGRVVSKPAGDGRALLDLNHATVTGDVAFDDALVAGAVDLACCRITGDVYFHRLQATGAVDLRNATVAGSVRSQSQASEADEADDPFGGVARAATLSMGAARLRGGLQLEGFSGGSIEGESLQAGFVRIGRAAVASLGLRGARISGSAALTACDVEAGIDLRNFETDEIVLAGCACRELVLTAARIRRAAWLTPYGNRVLHVRDRLDAYALSVGMDLRLAGVDASIAPLDLRNARLGSLLVSPGLHEPEPGRVAPVDARFGRLDGRGIEVEGNVEIAAQLIGPVDLDSATIRGRLDFAARRIESDLPFEGPTEWFEWACRHAREHGFSYEPTPYDFSELAPPGCGQVSLRLMSCAGDVDLSRLTIAPTSPGVASLDASGADIKGSLLLCDPASASGGEGLVLLDENATVLAGGARIGHLRVSGESFVWHPEVHVVGTSWTVLDVFVFAVSVLGLLAFAGAALAGLGAIAWDGGGFADFPAVAVEPGANPAWKYGGVAILLLVLGLACLREAWRVFAITLDKPASDRSTRGIRRLSPRALAQHHLLQLHGIDRRELTLASLQLWFRVLLSAALCALVAWPYLHPASAASPGALRIPLLAVVALLLWAYVRSLLATLHAHACSSKPPSRQPPSSVALTFFRGLKNAAAILVAADVWALYGVALALSWSRIAVPGFVMQRPLATLAIFLVLPFAALWSTRRLQVWIRRRVQQKAEQAPPPADEAPPPAGEVPSLREVFEESVRPGPVEDPVVPDRRPRPDIAGLSLHVMAFRDVMQVATGNVIKSSTYRGQRAALDLDRASIGDLEILKPIPRYVGISNLTVQRWRIDGADEVQNTLEVLDHAAEFEADMYQKVADTLRNGGQRADAEVVHRASRRQARWRETRWGKTLLSLLHGLIGYGTHRGPLLAVMGLWFVFTATWFGAEYERVLGPGPAYALDALQIGDCNVELAHTTVDECRLLNDLAVKPLQPPDLSNRVARALSVAIRYHIPIIPWDMYPYAQPKETYVWAYTVFVTAVHWILWPLLLASLIPAVLPRGTRD